MRSIVHGDVTILSTKAFPPWNGRLNAASCCADGNGAEHSVACQCTEVHDGAGGKGVVIVLRDITRALFLEKELLKNQRLESAGLLAAGIARDFNDLLTGITTSLFMARMSAVADIETCSLIGEAEKAALKASSLTSQLLSFANGAPPIKETASIKELVRDTIGFCLSGTDVDYRLELPDDLFPVEVDKGQIDQALANLLRNAAQAMPGGGVTVRGANCTIGLPDSPTAASRHSLPLPPGRYVKISVTDEGAGIPGDSLERIFDPYFTTGKSGSGLGLTIAYSIIKRHDGHIEAESRPGRGSTFTLYLPASAPGGEEQTTVSPALERGTGRILIMNDDTAVRTVVETLLSKTGYTPCSVADGTRALECYIKARERGQPFVAAIVDLAITGGMGGKEIVQKLREIDPSAKVIAFSDYANDPIRGNHGEFGCDGVLSKPFSVEEFMRTLRKVLMPPSSDANPAPKHRERA